MTSSTSIRIHAYCHLRWCLRLAGVVLPIALLSGSALARRQAPAQDAVWLEGEGFTASKSAKPNISGWGHPEWLSGDKWLQVSVDADKVEKELPARGGLLTYDFNAPTRHEYEVWNRIGYEFVRSPFQWRIDGGAGKPSRPNSSRSDLMEFRTGTKWRGSKWGAEPDARGAQTGNQACPKRKDDKGDPARILYASDALCLYPGHLLPQRTQQARNQPAHNRRIRKRRSKLYFPSAGAEGEHATRRKGNQATHRQPAIGSRQFSCSGQWEICRNDEDLPGEVAAPD